ncbi:MAG: hypothetical protein ABR585_08205 [Gemmatimonadaceae bacterium]
MTKTGDTLSKMGGGLLASDGAKDYAVDQYWKNGTRYLRVLRAVARTAGGQPIWSTRARLRLPAMKPSETIMFGGSCRKNDKSDPFMLAIVTDTGGSVPGDVKHAWRFDSVSEMLREIATKGISCVNVAGG